MNLITCTKFSLKKKSGLVPETEMKFIKDGQSLTTKVNYIRFPR